MSMNYETGQIGNEERLALPGYAEVEPSNRRRNIILAIIAVLVVVGLAFWAFGSGKKDGAAAAAGAAQLPTVTVMVPGHQSVDREVSATGTLAARREMPVGVAGEGGMITRVLVEPGQWVGAGQVLATIDRRVQTQTAASLAASINVAKADAAIAQSDLDRAQKLVDRGFIAKSDLERKAATRDAANARVKVAQATLGEARARTGQLDIRAPAAGLILTRGVEPGQIVSPGSGVLFRMAKGGEMELRAVMSEGDLAAMKVGLPASVTPVGMTNAFDGRIWQVSPVIDPSTRQGMVRIALAYNTALRPGGFAAATLRSGESSVPLLPNSAIQSDRKGNFVYVIGAGDKAERRDVKVGDVSDGGAAITGGLNGTERIAVAAGAFLSPGQQVKPVLQKTTG